MNKNPIIKVENLVKKFGNFTANDNLTFEVYKGEIFGFLGANGAGSNLSATVNSTEVKKLMKHNGLAVLILFDFSKTPYSEDQIESFRDWPSLGMTAEKIGKHYIFSIGQVF